MSKNLPMQKGDAVAICSGRLRDPERVTTISVVRRRGGEIVGYGTADGCSWSPGGTERTEGFDRRTIVPATPGVLDAIERRGLVGRITGTRGEAWSALPLDVLKRIVGDIDAARVPS